jgi:hypothetical protein
LEEPSLATTLKGVYFIYMRSKNRDYGRRDP